jgi:hypothetical protein
MDGVILAEETKRCLASGDQTDGRRWRAKGQLAKMEGQQARTGEWK